MHIEPIDGHRCGLGESPFWWDAHQQLVYVDVYGGKVCTWNPGGQSRVRHVGERVTFVIPTADDGLILGLRHGMVAVAGFDGPDGELNPSIPVEADMPTTSVNDARCDARGRLWFGTIERANRDPICALYTWDRRLGLQKQVPGVTISNGIQWSPDGRLMYYVDSWLQRLDVFDYDPSSGALGERRTVASVPAEAGMPDGITVDADGLIYVALFGGGKIHRYEPNGRLESVFALPTRYPTSCGFGGADLRTLFITTHKHPSSESELDGAVLATDVAATGLPSRPYPGSYRDFLGDQP